MPINPEIKIGILTVSDRVHQGKYEDLSGPAIIDLVRTYLESPWTPLCKVTPDAQGQIRDTLIEMIDLEGCCFVITTGGTGPTKRDVTPEATQAVCDKILPGFGEQMRNVSLKHVPTAILSRQTAGIRGTSLILNLPGNPRAIKECLPVILGAAVACIELIGGPSLKCNPEVITVNHPKH